MANDQHPKCERCSQPMTYVKDAPEESYASGGQITVPFDSHIFRCPDHGLWRVYINGVMKPYRE